MSGRVEIPYIDPVEAAARLCREPRFAFLDSAMPHDHLGRWSYLACRPTGLFSIEEGLAKWNGDVLAGPPLQALRTCLASHAPEIEPGGPPFQGGAIGFFAYEAGGLFETLPKLPAPTPQAEFAFYDTLLAIDGSDRRAFVIGPRRDWLTARLHAPAPEPPPAPAIHAWRAGRSREAYEAEVAGVIEAIRNGDVFQVNLSQAFLAEPAARPDPLGTYLALRAANPAPFAALLVNGERFIASTSPERFMRVDGGDVETRPIKGTARRAANPGDDRDIALARGLKASVKDRAENIMIVDLLRNDLSRVCKPQSVTVPVLCEVETYPSVHHLVSVVRGELQEGRDALDLIAACFPGGSITGAPKIKAMEIIAAVEGEARGVYCGAIGWLGGDGACDLSIAIRTLTYDGQVFTVRAGGGITLLSDPKSEYDETLAKAERLLGAFARTDRARA